MIRLLINRIKRSGSKPWQEQFTLSQLLTLTAVFAIISASLTAGYYALNVLYQNKLVDTWAIMFLELEHEGTVLNQQLQELARGIDQATKNDDIVLNVNQDGSFELIQGSLSGVSKLLDFKLGSRSELSLLPQLTVISDSGQYYLAHFTPREARLILRKVASRYFGLHPARPADQGALYLITREGHLLYSNERSITELTLTDRALVQKFIKAPIKQGQLAFTTADGQDLYGFFAEVPNTNVILFSEVTKAAAMAPIRQIVVQFLGVLLGIVVGVIGILQMPLSRITAPIKELANIATMVGSGHFNVEPKLQAVGELSSLSKAFGSMAKGLTERDRRLAELMREQAEKFRLEGEMAIARRIQENLLPTGGLPQEAGLTIAAVYISASECAGDWYQYAYNPQTRETVFVIADVSGHGAGSSVFTAVIAGLFDQAAHRSEQNFPMEAFVSDTNAAIHRLGKEQWHATMFIGRYVADGGILEFINAGHPSPFVKRIDTVEALKYGSDNVIGLNLNAHFQKQQVNFDHRDTLMMYTDGLIEAARKDGKMFGRKRARELLNHVGQSPSAALTEAMDSWKAYLGDATPADDVCVMMVRAA